MIKRNIQEITNLICGKVIYNDFNPETMIHGICIDSREFKVDNLYVPIIGEHVDSHKFIKQVEETGCKLVLCSNEKYLPTHAAAIIVDDTISALQELAKNYRASLSCKVVGITGSNGKTSCKDMLAAALCKKYKTQKTAGNKNNEIGVPLTLLSLDDDCEVAVVEMGMENKDEIHFLNNIVQQDISLITSVGIAHLENLGSLENIGHAKLEIIDNLHKGDFFTFCGDDPILSKLYPSKKLPEGIIISLFGEQSTNDIYLKELTQSDEGISFKTNKSDFMFKINILGKHQALNALGAINVAYYLGLNDEKIQSGFMCLENTKMRNELIKINHCNILNDAYKSNPQSAIAALDTLNYFENDYKVVVLGDMLELGPTSPNLHFELGCQLNKYHLSEIVCVGDMSKHIYDGALSTCNNSKVSHFNTNDEVFNYIKDLIYTNCMILFKGSRGMHLDLIIDKMKEYGEKNEQN